MSVVPAVMLLVLAGCGDGGAVYDVEVSFVAPLMADQVGLIEISRVEGACGVQPFERGGEPVGEVATLARSRDGRTSGDLGTVPDGRHYLYTRAFSRTDCRVIGAGCQRVDVDSSGGTVLLELEQVAGPLCVGCAVDTCTGTRTCGDRELVREECDDGNTAAGDGCSPTCAVEAAWVCTAEPSRCSPAVTCLDHHEAGARIDGAYPLQPLGDGARVDLYCDMTTDGGGWTLLAVGRGGETTAWDTTAAISVPPIPSPASDTFKVSDATIGALTAGGPGFYRVRGTGAAGAIDVTRYVRPGCVYAHDARSAACDATYSDPAGTADAQRAGAGSETHLGITDWPFSVSTHVPTVRWMVQGSASACSGADVGCDLTLWVR